jgi:hypothetical protein
MRLACSVTRSSSLCCFVAASWYRRICSSLAGSAPPRSMLASCPSSRGHIGFTGAPCCWGGGPGFICAQASMLATLTLDSAAQARIERNKVDRKTTVISVSGISGQYRRRASHSRFSGQRHVVSGAPVWRVILARTPGSALAGNRDVFDASGTIAVLGRLGNRAGDFLRVDAPVGRGLGEIPRLAIESGCMGAAFVAPGETLVDTIAVRLVGNDKDAAVGRCSRSDGDERTGQNHGYGSHTAPKPNEGIAGIG